MVNDRRRLWTRLIFIGIFAPFLTVFLLTLFGPRPALPQSAAATADQPAQSPVAALFGRPRSSAPVGTHANAPLLAAGDGHDIWVVHPFILDSNGAPFNVFELLKCDGNSGTWNAAVQNNNAYWNSFPQALAVLPGSAGPTHDGLPVVMNAEGRIEVFSLDRKNSLNENLPSNQVVRAAVGSGNTLFAITYGPPPAVAATRPGDRLFPDTPETEPATTPAATMAPATTAADTEPARSFNACIYRDSHWLLLPSLGSLSNDPSIPSPSSQLSLAVVGNRLLALWVDPIRPGDLTVRTLDSGSHEPAWSPPIVTTLSEPLPPGARLFTCLLDKTLYVLWTVPTGSSIELHGGVLNTDARLSTVFLKLPLGPSAQGVSPLTDIAVAPCENALVAIVITREGNMAALAFNDRGQAISPATTIEIHSVHRDLQVGQNLMMIVLAVVLTLSFWQWRQRPLTMALPPQMVSAPLHLRAGAFLIDAALAYFPVIIAFSVLGSSDTSFGLAFNWMGLLLQPAELFRSPEFITFFALYLLHVSIGELLARKSIGKALLGLQVLMIDGRAPTLAAVLLRNLVRLPELCGLILFLFLSEHHQRLGDLLARTMVVTPQPPEIPPDSDAPPTPPKG